MNIGQEFFGGANKLSTLSGPVDLVTLILRGSFVLASLILLFYFILGGIGMIGSAGKNDPKSAEQAKQTITSAVTGFVVVFVAYWIVKLIGNILKFPNLI